MALPLLAKLILFKISKAEMSTCSLLLSNLIKIYGDYRRRKNCTYSKISKQLLSAQRSFCCYQIFYKYKVEVFFSVKKLVCIENFSTQTMHFTVFWVNSKNLTHKLFGIATIKIQVVFTTEAGPTPPALLVRP